MRDYVLLHPHSFERKRGIEREGKRERIRKGEERESFLDTRSSRKFLKRIKTQKKLMNGCVYNLKGLYYYTFLVDSFSIKI